MSTTRPVCAVKLIGAPDIELSYKGGGITFDEATVPHVQGTVRVARPAAVATLAALDPRQGARIRVTVVTVGALGTTTRDFNLGLRRRPARLVAGEIELQLASDEALLNDYAPLTDDLTPFTYQSSIRAIVAYALGKIGAVLAASPTADASAQTYADSVNIIANGGARADIVGYSGTGNLSRLTGQAAPEPDAPTTAARITKTGADAGGIYYGQTAITPGKTYTASAWVRSSVAKTVRLSVEQATSGGASAGANIHGAAVNLTANTWTRITVTFTAYATGTSLGVYSYLTAGAWANGNTYDILGIRVSEPTGDPTDLSFFDSTTPASAGYSYAASAAQHKRTALLNRPVDAMRWPAGRKAMEWIAPIVQAAGFRLICDETRKWTLRPAGYVAGSSLSIRSEVNVIDSVETLQRGGEWFDGQVTEYRWIDPTTGTRKTAIDAWSLTATPTLVNYVVVDAPYPGPGRSEYAVRRAQQRGRELVLTVPADWTATAEQMLTALLDGLPIQTGKTSRVDFNLDRDEMTLTTRTTDTPAGAIDLAVGTIDGGSAGTIDAD